MTDTKLATLRIPVSRLSGPTFLLLAALAAAAMTLSAPARAGMTVYTDDGAAIGGYDPVAYFTDGKPVEGTGDYTYDWQGVTWRFASAEHRDAFAADPEKYAPQYGGFCAWAVSEGYTAKSDPDAWHIEGDRLFLNYNKSVQARWRQDTTGNIARGDANWPKIEADLTAK